MKNLGSLVGVGIALLVFLALGADVIAASAIKGNDMAMYIACIILAGVFAAMKITPVAIFCIAIPALAVAWWGLSLIWAAITGFFLGFGKVIMTVLGIVIAIGVVTYLNNRNNRNNRRQR